MYICLNYFNIKTSWLTNPLCQQCSLLYMQSAKGSKAAVFKVECNWSAAVLGPDGGTIFFDKNVFKSGSVRLCMESPTLLENKISIRRSC